jgi:hypothetical protein
MFRQGFTCLVLLFVNPLDTLFEYRAITFYGQTFQTVFLKVSSLMLTGLVRVRSPLLTESRLISFPPGT